MLIDRPFRSWRRVTSGVAILLAATATAAGAQDRPRILVSNDDGVMSEGIAAIAEALREFADVEVVAPEVNESGASHRTVVRRQVTTVKRVERDGVPFGHSVNASPADAVKFGLLHLGAERPFDLVVSGINEGANVGNVAHMSGTVGAAMEAVLNGVPAIAVSQGSRPDYSLSAAVAADIIEQTLERGLPPGTALSINIPGGEIRGVRAAPMGGLYFRVGSFELVEGDEGSGEYRTRLGGAVTDGDHTDTALYLDGYITVTPIRLDWTDSDLLRQLEAWRLELPAGVP